MFRALGLYFIKKGIKLEDETAVVRLLDDIDIKVVYKDEGQRIMLSGEDVTGHLRSEEAAGAASSLSVYSAVREKLLCMQRDIAKQYNVVMDGRDIGTKVLPDADVKIYLTAGIKERAKRRFFELVQKGEKPDIKKIERDMQDRDYRDMHRKNSPLAKAEDAYEIDTTDMTIKEVVEKILDIAALTG
jgi:cytidylate kinase